MSARPSIRDIAREAGVSPAMVSRVLNGRIATETEIHRRIRRLLSHRGYRRKKKVPTGGYLVCLGKTDPARLSANTLHLEAALAAAARAENYQMVISRGADVTAVNQLIRKLHAVGVLRIAPEWDGPTSVPLVTVSYELRNAPAPCVGVDEAAYWRDSLVWLASLGHRRVACFTHWAAREDDMNPFCDLGGLYRLAGLPFAPELVCNEPFACDAHGPVIAAALDRWLARPYPPTAVVLVDDVYAPCVYAEARRRGLAIPRDLSLIGRGNSPAAAMLEPPLTTHEDPLDELAAAAVAMIKGFQNGSEPVPRRVLIAPRRLPRASVAARQT